MGMNDYEILEIHGHGASGIAIKVKHIETGEIRCLKKIDLSKSTTDAKILKHEVEVIQKLDHPNIIKYYEYFIEEKWFCIVMEYADNGDLETLLQNQKALLSEADVLRIGCQIAAGVSYIHSQGMVHRDLKPGNILLCKNGLIKIGDFGLSKLASVSTLHTQVGTPAYFSPEVVNEDLYLYESDDWALGCIFYELISLKKAFFATPLDILFQRIRNDDPNPLTGWYSPELFVLIDDLLKKDQHQRLSSRTCVQSPIFAQAFITLGLKFQEGIEYEKNAELSNFYFKLALEASNSKGLGWTHNATSTKTHTLRQLFYQAEIGSANDAFVYALYLLKGVDSSLVSVDEACRLFQKGSEDGDPFLTYVYGLTFKLGFGTSRIDKKKAMILFKKAADLGDPNGFLEYGICLKNGDDGYHPRRKLAMKWYKKSADYGSSDGMACYGIALEFGYDKQGPRIKEAREWYKKSALYGNPFGMFNLGDSLEQSSDGNNPRKKEAMIWYRKSAEAGNSYGMKSYARALRTGLGGAAPRIEEAQVWQKKVDS